MPRHPRLRKVVSPPNFKGYKPYGAQVKNYDKVELLYEEYEAIKLTDYDYLHHNEAAKLMGVSRATFARIYEAARKKIAKALVETKAIEAVFGNVIVEKNWFKCMQCSTRFTLPVNIEAHACPLCGTRDYTHLND